MENRHGGNSRRKESTRKTIHSWVANIKMDLREIGWGGMDWIDLAQDRDHGNEPSGFRRILGNS
jgi:hypothetical protein